MILNYDYNKNFPRSKYNQLIIGIFTVAVIKDISSLLLLFIHSFIDF